MGSRRRVGPFCSQTEAHCSSLRFVIDIDIDYVNTIDIDIDYLNNIDIDIILVLRIHMSVCVTACDLNCKGEDDVTNAKIQRVCYCYQCKDAKNVLSLPMQR